MGPKIDPTRAPKLTHFLCIPLVTPSSRPQLLKSLTIFKRNVTDSDQTSLSESSIPTPIPEKAIRPIGTLHLTLGVMSLLTPEKVDGVLNLLKSIDFPDLLRKASSEEIPGKSGVRGSGVPQQEKEEEKEEKEKIKEKEDVAREDPLTITLKGLKSTRSTSRTSVLYSSPVDEDLRLYRFCNYIQQLFIEKGFIVDQKRKLLLHATILNTLYAKKVKKEDGKKGKTQVFFDGRDIIERYKESVWVEEMKVESIAICRMGAKVGEDGEERYEVEGEVVL